MALWVVAVVACGTTGAVLWGSAVVARHRAGVVADLAALAAAAAAPGTDGCARAGQVAADQGARLVSCRVLADGSTMVEVTVAASADEVPGTGPARARARAGRPP